MLKKKQIDFAVLNITYTRSNIFFNLTNESGDTIFVFSGGQLDVGKVKHKNSVLLKNLLAIIADKLFAYKVRTLDINLKNCSKNIKKFFYDITNKKIIVRQIKDFTQLAHNGVKKSSKKRK